MWAQIRSNKIRSVILVAALAAVLLVLGYFLGAAFLGSGLYGLLIALIVWAIMNLVAYFQGNALILSISRARKIGPDDYPRLWNVVEEMKIASGLEKMPDVYIIDDPAMNAFATGRDPKHAAVTVTSGLLQKMNRDELQGVVAHEMSHIQNRDVLLMTLCSVLLGTIVILAWYGSRVMLFSGGSGGRRSGSGGGGNGAAIIMIIALLLAILAPIFAQLIYFAISRKREYLADASGALYTRYPEGLASALEKIADSTVGLKSANQAFAPMYIANPFRKEGRSASDLTSTHPPIRERIKILRSMAGGASFVDYNKAFQQVRNIKQNVIPGSTLAGAAGLVTARQQTPALDKSSESQQKLERAREVSGLLDKLHQYTALACQCGTAFRIPPDYKGKVIRCPRCGRDNQIPHK
jgi:heat shock protein HtpX